MDSNFDVKIVSTSESETISRERSKAVISGSLGLWVLADGLEGRNGSERAAEIVVEVVTREFQNQPAVTEAFVELLFDRAHEAVRSAQASDASCRDMATTLLILISDGERAVYGSIGDTHLYLARREDVRLVTKAHTSATQGLHKAVGLEQQIKADVSHESLKLYRGDRFLLCVNRFWRNLSESEMATDHARSATAEAWLGHMHRRVIERRTEESLSYTAIAVGMSGAHLGAPPVARKRDLAAGLAAGAVLGSHTVRRSNNRQSILAIILLLLLGALLAGLAMSAYAHVRRHMAWTAAIQPGDGRLERINDYVDQYGQNDSWVRIFADHCRLQYPQWDNASPECGVFLPRRPPVCPPSPAHPPVNPPANPSSPVSPPAPVCPPVHVIVTPSRPIIVNPSNPVPHPGDHHCRGHEHDRGAGCADVRPVCAGSCGGHHRRHPGQWQDDNFYSHDTYNTYVDGVPEDRQRHLKVCLIPQAPRQSRPAPAEGAGAPPAPPMP